jgi:hypothetical protein
MAHCHLSIQASLNNAPVVLGLVPVDCYRDEQSRKVNFWLITDCVMQSHCFAFPCVILLVHSVWCTIYCTLIVVFTSLSNRQRYVFAL